LLPPSPSDWLAEGHLAYFIAEIVDTLDVESFYARYEGDGRRNSPYDPRMLLKVLVYAYASGVFSSRRIAKKLEEDVAFRVLGAGNFPDHRTVNRFRQEHLEEFAGMFQQVVKLAREMKLLHMGTLAIDGTKVRANASKHKAMSYGRMKEEEEKLKGEIAELLRRDLIKPVIVGGNNSIYTGTQIGKGDKEGDAKGGKGDKGGKKGGKGEAPAKGKSKAAAKDEEAETADEEAMDE